ncbi:uncharacterized protein LOC125551892 [Triticum urartu]|uniref:uncharacterized protein LOC125551892 n=1 Tax=Triticum urartu TaxID=4572 RepID=UPI0020433BD6|nr:uncharacterized protein LOC125551892 [Triticum urartu]
MYYVRAFECRAQALQQATPARGGRQPARLPPTPPVPGQLPPAAPTTTTPATTRPFRRLFPAEQLERCRQGLCYNCDKPYVSGHVCPRLFYLEVADYVEDTPADGPPPVAAEAAPAPTPATALVVSLQALAGIRDKQTMLLPVMIHGECLVALLDTGSTHNFLPEATMRRLALQLTGGEQLRVTVANGDRLRCHGLARNMPITIGDEHFTITCVGIDLGCFDFILGVDFLRTLGPILWDFGALTMTFWRLGRRVRWEGMGGASPAMQLAVTAAEPEHPLLDHLLQQHRDLFHEPRGLPPARVYDHRIHLLPGTAPVAVRPYRYPQLQKDELEQQWTLMLALGIIRISTSPFSARVLVRKSDGMWRFCIDYRALNAQTLKDKFPIPVVDELLDELHRVRFFTKLDLRSGYHQVRMHLDDVAKTAFRTHHGHFEFLVMPFGLCNTPATFQALMNDVLRPYLRRFVLVFFDDILIYSASWAEHLQHVAIVFNKL